MVAFWRSVAHHLELMLHHPLAAPWWDRLFGTYRAQPEAGHEGLTIGLELFRDPSELRLDRMLMQSLRRERAAERLE